MLMAALQMIWSISITSYNLWFTLSNMTLRPWTTWADVHSNFGRIDRYPAIIMPENVAKAYYASWLVIPISSWLFVAFFAFGRDAVQEYKKCFNWMRVRAISLVPRKCKKGRKIDSTNLTATQWVWLFFLSPWLFDLYLRRFNGLPISSPNLVGDTLSPSSHSFHKTTNMSTDDAVTDYYCHCIIAPPLPLTHTPNREAQYPNNFAAGTTTMPQINIPPLTPPPPPRRPRIRGLISVERVSLPSRPVTYPSQDIYYREFDLESHWPSLGFGLSLIVHLFPVHSLSHCITTKALTFVDEICIIAIMRKKSVLWN